MNSFKSNSVDFEITEQEYENTVKEIKGILPLGYSLIHASTVKSQKIGYYNGVIAVVYKNQPYQKDIYIHNFTL